MKGVCRGEKWLQFSGSMFLVPTKNRVKFRLKPRGFDVLDSIFRTSYIQDFLEIMGCVVSTHRELYYYITI